MPLAIAGGGEVASIKRVGDKDEVRRHLENVGFVPGMDVMVVSINDDNVIINVKSVRAVISGEMANKVVI